jgi:acyl carrier protein
LHLDNVVIVERTEKAAGWFVQQAQERNSGMDLESPVGKQIREVLATSLRRDASTIKPEHHLRDDLGLDSLMTFELLYDLEKAFDLEIPNDDLPGLQTLDDVVKYIEGRVSPDTKTSAPKTKEKKPASTKPAKPAQAKKATAKTRKAPAPTKPRAAATATKQEATTASSKKRTTTSKRKVIKK